ncbi:glycosyltransferase family 39 protein, partial [Megasphaera sp.]
MLSALRHHRRLVLAFFLLAAAFLYLAHIGSYHLIELDEGRYHRIPMEMVLSGDYLTPHFDYMPYFEKPILQYWVTALAMKIFGFKEFTGRVLPALTGFGNVLLAYVLGRSMYNGRTGLMAAIILATSALQLIVASIGVLDMALTFFVDACLVTFYLFERTEEKKYLLLFYTAMGLGMLTKGLIAIAFPVGILFWYAMLTRRPKLFLKLFYVPGILLFLAISVPWYYLVSQANPDFFYFFFIREHFLRFATKMHERFHPWYYFVPVLIAGLMPWTGFLATFFSKKGIFRAPGTLRHKQDIILLSLWAGLIYVFYSISDSKLPTYI